MKVWRAEGILAQIGVGVGVVDGKLKVTAKPRVPNHYIDRVYMNWIGTVFGSISAQTGKGLVTTTQNDLYES